MHQLWIRKRIVPVSTEPYQGRAVDVSLFDQVSFEEIIQDGFKISPIGIAHAASVHYAGRFRSGRVLKFVNAFIEIFASVSPCERNLHLAFNDSENSEFQAKSTEVISVGLCVALCEKLFGINKNRISLIEGSGKRCDFEFNKENLRYVVEAKGRKGETASAIQDVFSKKSVYDPDIPKYGFINHIPRDGSRTSIKVVDPEYFPRELSRKEQVEGLLLHYAKVAQLSGFMRLSEVLVQRVLRIRNAADLSDFEGRPLDYENIIKIGRPVALAIRGVPFEAFSSPENAASIIELSDGFSVIHAMDREIIGILDRQDYSDLLTYRYINDREDAKKDEPVSIGSDGSVFAIVAQGKVRITDNN